MITAKARMTGSVYADLRIMVANRKRLIREMTQIKNRFARWFAIYFPEYTDVFGDYEAQSSMLLLKKVCTPEEGQRPCVRQQNVASA